MQRRINEAEGKAEEILTISRATAESIERIAEVISAPGGQNVVRMQLGAQYLKQLDGLSHSASKIVLPGNMMDFDYWMGSIGLKEDNPKA